MTKQDAEVAAGLRVLRLLVQHKTSNSHQVRTVRVRFVIHLLRRVKRETLSFSKRYAKIKRWIQGREIESGYMCKRRGLCYRQEMEEWKDTWRVESERKVGWSSLKSEDSVFRQLVLDETI